MVDFNKVSKNVQNFVADVMKLDGKEKRIDSDREYFALSNALSMGLGTMNKEEIGYIQGLMIEYEQKQEEKFENEAVTKDVKKQVSNIAKRMGKKNLIDSDVEALELSALLNNSHGDMNAADLFYIKKLLVDSGYANYLPKPDIPPVQVVNVTVNEFIVDEKVESSANGDNNSENTPEQEMQNNSKETNTTPSIKKSRKPYKPTKPNQPPKGVPNDTDKQKAEVPKKHTISEAARAQGFGIADKIQEELHDTWTNNSLIQNELQKVNRKNAYSFVGKMIEITDSHTVFGDARKRITYKNIKHVIANLLNQAFDIGLNNSSAWKNLKAEYNAVSRQIDKEPNKTPDEFDINKLNKAVKDLYNEMSKVYN